MKDQQRCQFCGHHAYRHSSDGEGIPRCEACETGQIHEFEPPEKPTARGAGWSQARIDAVLKEMRSSDYDHLLVTAREYFDVE